MMKQLLILGILALVTTGCCCDANGERGRRSVCIKAKDRYIRSYCAQRCSPCPCCAEQKSYPEAGCCYE